MKRVYAAEHGLMTERIKDIITMKRVYAAEHGLMTERIKDILEEEGIDCMIKNMNLSGGVGQIPPIECWPEVWVMADKDYGHAKTIVEDLLKDFMDMQMWREDRRPVHRLLELRYDPGLRIHYKNIDKRF